MHSAIIHHTHSASIVHKDEVSLGPEVRFLELVVGTVLSDQLLNVGLVCGLRKPALLVQQRQDSHWLCGEEGRENRTQYTDSVRPTLLHDKRTLEHFSECCSGSKHTMSAQHSTEYTHTRSATIANPVQSLWDRRKHPY